MNRESKKHHFVPRSLLRYFSIRAEGDSIHVFDKRNGKAFEVSLTNAGSQNNFNKLETDAGVWNFEPIFEGVDARLATLLRQIHQLRNVASLSPNDRRDWADMVAVQLVRTPLTRTTHTQMSVDLVDAIGDVLGTSVNIPASSDNDARASSLRMFEKRDGFRAALEDKDLVLFRAGGRDRFLTSDHPVVRQSTVPYGDAGLSSPGIAIYLPLGPDLLLGLLCKSVQFKHDAQPIGGTAIPMDVAQRRLALGEGLRTGEPVVWGDEYVARFNKLQVAGSSRFLYGSEDSFDKVRMMLERRPELQDVRSFVNVGRTPSGPGASRRMPEGQWLVLYGQQSHYMVAIYDWSDDHGPFEASVSDSATLRQALNDAPFNEMGIYVDKQQRRMMRGVRVDIVESGPPLRIQVRHSDSGLDALDT